MSSYDATNPRFTWWPEYDAIAIANSIIANLHRIGLPEDRFNNYMGQARFIRAYLYFCVVRDFGDVPLPVSYTHLKLMNSDDTFVAAITSATGDKGRVNYRYNKVHEILYKCLSNDYKD